MSNKKGYDLRRRALISQGVMGTDRESGGSWFGVFGMILTRNDKYSSQLRTRISHMSSTLITSSCAGASGGRGSAASKGCGFVGDVSGCDSVFNCIASCANGEILFFTP